MTASVWRGERNESPNASEVWWGLNSQAYPFCCCCCCFFPGVSLNALVLWHWDTQSCGSAEYVYNLSLKESQLRMVHSCHLTDVALTVFKCWKISFLECRHFLESYETQYQPCLRPQDSASALHAAPILDSACSDNSDLIIYFFSKFTEVSLTK